MQDAKLSHGWTLALLGWGVASPLLGIIIGHVLSRSWQLEQWRMDRRWQDYQAVMTAVTSAYTAMIRLTEASTTSSFTPELMERVDSIKRDSFRVIRDRITIADELEHWNILADWDAAVTNYEADPDQSRRFAERFNDLNDRLIRMARRTPPGQIKQWWTRLRWRTQHRMIGRRKRSG